MRRWWPAAAVALSALALLAMALAAGERRGAPADAPAASTPAEAPTPSRIAAEPAPPPRAAPGPPRGGAPGSEDLLSQLRREVDRDPARALELAREAERRDGDAPGADERDFLAMRALVHLGRISDARTEARAFFERRPESPFAERVYRLTGVHPMPPPPQPGAAGR